MDYLAALDSGEYRALVDESRGASVRASTHAKCGELAGLISNADGNGHQRAEPTEPTESEGTDGQHTD